MKKGKISESSQRGWFEAHSARFSGALLFNEPLARYTYYQIGGPAHIFAVPKSREDLQWLRNGIRETGIPFFILGKGSNLLISDQGFPGLVIRTHQLNLEMSLITSADESFQFLRTGSSIAISSLLRRAGDEGWAGLEFLTGVPGAVGGAITMNAGTHLGETQGALLRVEAYSMSPDPTEGMVLKIFDQPRIQFNYRKNLFLESGDLVWSADWKIHKAEPSEVKACIDEALRRRKATQPVDFPSCGSVFKNPKAAGLKAWEVIDRLGLRGHQVGMAQFSEKHPNFIINLGGAKAEDVLVLIRLAQSRAETELGLILEEEVIFVQ